MVELYPHHFGNGILQVHAVFGAKVLDEIELGSSLTIEIIPGPPVVDPREAFPRADQRALEGVIGTRGVSKKPSIRGSGLLNTPTILWIKTYTSTSITERSEVVKQRDRLGDIEVDLMMGKTHKSDLLVLTDRATLLTALQKVISRKAKSIVDRIIQRLGRFPSPFIKTLTFDNDKPFARHQKIADS